jgi:hypothetical protein
VTTPHDTVMAEIDPAIHAFVSVEQERRGCPGPVSAKAAPGRRLHSAAEAFAKAASPGMTSR